MTKLTAQQKADAVRRTVERVLDKGLALPLTLEKVAQLQIARELVEQLKACNIAAAGASFGETASLDRKLAEIERACRDFGLIEAYADTTVARRNAIRECIEKGGL